MQEDRYIWLLYQRLNDQLTPQEAAELNDWLEASSENRALADRIELAWEKSADYPDLPPVDLDQEFHTVISRIRTGTTLSRNRILFSSRALGLAAAILLVLSSFGLWIWIGSGEPEWETAFATTSTQEIVLFDGTRVTLREGSRLEFPSGEINRERPVRLEGEAYFEVAENPNAPFRVTTTDTRITVLGTQFNVRALAGDSLTTIAVSSGKVSVESGKTGKRIILTAGLRGRYNTITSELWQEDAPNLNDLAWMRRDFQFRNTKLTEVLGYMENAFDIKIHTRKDVPVDCPLSGRYSLDNGPEGLLDNLRSFLEIDWEQTREDEFVIRGGQCPE